ncbi:MULTISPECIES: oligosaccharide flippase family protein [unclassified Saccharicrinis]|uniref:oligosaccharide flippase family protein n=1 Tax=unclassified Saccharicrinis TaxID=2646859 RepID=UPI003D353FE6
MSDIFNRLRSTVIQSFFYSLGNFFGKFSGIILLPIYLLYLPVEVFGLFALFEALFQIFQVFSGLGVKLGFARWYWDKGNTPNQKSLFFTAFTFNVIVCVLFSILLYLGFDLVSRYYLKTPIGNYLVVLFIVGNLIKLLSEIPMLLLRAQHRAKKHSVVQLVQLISFVGFVYVFLAWFKMRLEGLFWATILSASFQFLILIPVIVRNIKLKLEVKIIKDILKYGFPVALGNMVNVLFNFTDKYFINLFSNLKNVGTFTIAHKISNIVNLLIVNAFMNAYMHSYFKGADKEEGEKFFTRSFTYFLMVISFCSLLLILFIEEALMLFNTQQTDYKDSIILVPILTIGLIFGGIRQMLTLPINKIKKTKIIGTLSVVAGMLNVILNILFIPRWHAIGAAYATGIVQIISSGVLVYYTLKLTQLHLEWKRILILFVSLSVSIIPLYVIHIENFMGALTFKISLLLLWPSIIYFSGFLLAAEKDRINTFWIKWSKLSNLKNNINSLKNNH